MSQLRIVLICLCFSGLAQAQSTDSTLRTAYLEVYTQVSVALAARAVASECNPTEAAAYTLAIEAWERQHKVGSGFRNFASRVLTAAEIKATQIQEREEIIPKVKKAFVPCPNPARFGQMLASRDFDLTYSKPVSIAKIQEAMSKAGVVPVAPATAAPTASAKTTAGQVDAVLASQTLQIGTNGSMSSEIDFVVIYKDSFVTSDLNRVYVTSGHKPNQWGKFLREGDLLKVNWDSGNTETLKPNAMFKMQPAPNGYALEGVFRALESDGGVSASTGFEFFADGRFLTGTSSAPKRAGGTYKINGYTIELTNSNGTTEKQLFYLVPAQHKGLLGQIGLAGLRLVKTN
jgi:hypothetical protein